jgi:hypothetical protein
MATQMNDSQKVPYTLDPIDAKLVSTKDYDAGSIEGVSSDPAILAVDEDAANELTGFVRAAGVGSASVTWSGTSGGGANSFSHTEDFDVVAGPATGLNAVLGAPVAQ